MLIAYPLQPDQELLIEALRAPAPRPVQYVRRVRITRFLLLNAWVVGTILAHWFVEPEKRENVTVFAFVIVALLLYGEGVLRHRAYLLSRGDVAVGAVASREIILYNHNYWKSRSYQICYRFSDHENKMREQKVTVSKRIYEGCPEGSPITILYDSRFRLGSLPLLMIEEARLI